MSIKHMIIFIKVYQLLNITKAADVLYMSQPAVTRAIKEIESYYNIVLFDRINHRIYPTAAGKNFYEYALHIVDSFNYMEKSLKNIDEYGYIRFGTTISIGNTVLPKVLSIIKNNYPNLRIKVIVSNAEIIEKDINNNILDFGVIEGEVLDPGLKKIKIHEDSLIPILEPKSKFSNKTVNFDDVSNLSLLLREKGSISRDLVESNYNINNKIVDPILESESSQAIINAVHEGVGISFLPLSMVKKHLKSKYISTCTIKEFVLNRNNYLVWHKHKYISVLTKKIMDLFSNEMKNI